MIVIGLQLLDKMKEKLHKKSIDQEIDDAFSQQPGGSYSQKVLEGLSKFDKQDSEKLSDNYMVHRQPEPPKPIYGQQDQQNFQYPDNQNQLVDSSLKVDNPFEMPRSNNSPPPRRDEPLLNMARDAASTQEERREFFNSPPQRSQAASLGSVDNAQLLLEIKDLRAQNDHIINLLKNIQDRLRGY